MDAISIPPPARGVRVGTEGSNPPITRLLPWGIYPLVTQGLSKSPLIRATEDFSQVLGVRCQAEGQRLNLCFLQLTISWGLFTSDSESKEGWASSGLVEGAAFLPGGYRPQSTAPPKPPCPGVPPRVTTAPVEGYGQALMACPAPVPPTMAEGDGAGALGPQAPWILCSSHLSASHCLTCQHRPQK